MCAAAMRIEAALAAAVAVIAGLGLLASSGPPKPVRSGVVLDKGRAIPPEANLAWEGWRLPTQRADSGMAATSADAWGSSPLAVGGAQPASEAGVWATPAEFAESD
jgi:hypothetical protein